MVSDKPQVFLDRVGIDADDFGPGLSVAHPVVAQTAQLLGSDRRPVTGVEQQHNRFAASIA